MLSRVLLWLHAQRTSLAFMAVTFLTGTGAAFFIPTLSLFLSNEVGHSRESVAGQTFGQTREPQKIDPALLPGRGGQLLAVCLQS